jgi:hypothetical protein
MPPSLRTFLRLHGLFLIVFLCAVVVSSQDKDVEDDEPPPPPRIVSGVGVGIRNRDDEKTGSIIRGRAFYEDTGKPVRRGWIGFIKIRELVEKKAADQTKDVYVLGGSSYNAERYVLTNDHGEFVIRGFKAGVYIPTLKVKGVLNPDVSNRQNPLFQQIPVDGVNEVQVSVGVKRGGAISGRILYPDGEPVIGAKVQIFKNRERLTDSSPSYYVSSDSITVAVTDDRGFYRFAGLPAEEYFVRVVEPSVHSDSEKSVSSYEMAQFDSGSELKTFYPSVSTIKEAKSVAVVLGQEQSAIDIHIPDRRLFRISGTAIAKNSKNPLKGLKVRFEKMVEGQSVYTGYDRSKQTGTDEQGIWAFKDLPKGRYRVTVSMDDSYTDYSSTEAPKKESAPKYAPLSREIEIEDKDLQDLVFELASEATISGTVVVEGEKPFPNYVNIVAFDRQKKINSSTFLSSYSDGKKAENKIGVPKNFRLNKLSEGTFIFSAAVGSGYYIKSIKMGDTDLMKSPVELKDGQDVSGVQIVLGTDIAILKGKVNNYKPESRAFVAAIPVEAVALGVNGMQRSAGAMVKPNGEFEIQAAPGEYLVIVGTEKNRPQPEKQNLDEWFKELIKDALKVTLKSGVTETISLDYSDK